MKPIGRPPESPAVLFWSHVSFSDYGCWMWDAGKDRAGYGRFRYAGKTVRAHRFSYELSATIPRGMLVRHKCDNPSCVRPDHLEPGTAADNMRDKIERGRVPQKYRRKSVSP